MKNIVICGLVCLLVGLMSVAAMAGDKSPAQTAVDAALVIYNQHSSAGYIGAQTAFEKVLKDYPTASPSFVVTVQEYIIYCLFAQGKLDETKTACEKIIQDDLLKDYPVVAAGHYADALNRIGQILYSQGKYSEAQSAYESILKNYQAASESSLATAQLTIGLCLDRQRKTTEAQTAYMACVLNYVWQLCAANERGIICQAFDQINPKLMSDTEYKTFLTSVIKVTKATEENAKFLGRLKSELGKMQ